MREMMKTIAQQLNVKDFPFRIKDKNGNVIYYETSKGYSLKREFNSNGKLIYDETSDGVWTKREYDSNGNVIYYETSTGYWEKIEYDSDENQIYYETSDGYVEDNHQKPVEGKVVEIDDKKYKLTEA